MRALLFAVAIPVLAFHGSGVWAQDSRSLPRATPESQGVSSEKLKEFVESLHAKVNTMHSVMVVRHGKVIAEGWWAPQTPETRHLLWSLSKSFTSTAVGLAIAEGKLSLDDEVVKFFPDKAPEQPSKNLSQMRLRDLLRMATGHETEPKMPADGDWVKAFLAHPVPFKPGTHFRYNTPATFMQSAMVQKATGQTVLEYLKPRLFDPLGISGHEWGANPQGITLGGYGLAARTEDIAKFGQLYLQKGQWNGKQLVPAAWVEQATARQTSNGSNPLSDWDQGYGYQFWRCRHGAFRGDGAKGQFCVVLPGQDTVVAMTADTGDMQGEINVVWDSLLKELGDKPLPENPKGAKALAELVAGLKARK